MGFRGDALDRRLGRRADLSVFPEEMRGQEGDVFASLGETRHVDGNDIQAVEQIGAEFSFADRLLKIDVGGRDDADIRRERLVSADAFVLLLLQQAQQVCLHFRRAVADLVEKNGAAFGGFEQSFPQPVGARERAPLMAEELAAEQGLGEGAAVDGMKILRRARAVSMDGVRDEFLACAAFTGDQDRQLRGPGAANQFVDRQHSRTAADHVVLDGDALLQAAVLALEPGDGAGILQRDRGGPGDRFEKLRVSLHERFEAGCGHHDIKESDSCAERRQLMTHDVTATDPPSVARRLLRDAFVDGKRFVTLRARMAVCRGGDAVRSAAEKQDRDALNRNHTEDPFEDAGLDFIHIAKTVD